MTNKALLDFILKQYRAKGILHRVWGDSTVIKAVVADLQSQESAGLVDIATLNRLVNIFHPELAAWDISKHPSEILQMLPGIVNAVLTSIVNIEGVSVNLTLTDLHRKLWYREFKYMASWVSYSQANRTSGSFSGQSYQTLYFYLDGSTASSDLYCFCAVKDMTAKIELHGKQFDSIKQQLMEKTNISQFSTATQQQVDRGSKLEVTDQEVELLRAQLSRGGHFPSIPPDDRGEKIWAECLLAGEGIQLGAALKEIFDDYGTTVGFMLVAEKIVSLFRAGKLAALAELLEPHLIEHRFNSDRECFRIRSGIFGTYWSLFKEGVLVEANEPCILKLLTPYGSRYEDSYNFLIGYDFLELEKSNSLTAADKALMAVNEGENLKDILSALKTLKSGGLLIDKYRDVSLKAYPDRFGNQQLDVSVSRGLVVLKKAELLTDENLLVVEQAASYGIVFAAKYVAQLLVFLNKMDRLTPGAREKYFSEDFLRKISESYKIFTLLERLDKQNLLAGNFDFVLNNAKLLTKDSVERALRSLPDHLFTQEIWDEIARIIIQSTGEQVDAEIVLYLHLQLTPGRRYQPQVRIETGEHEWGAEQTAHTPSVELSAAVSVLALKKRYPLSPGDIARCIDELRLFSDIIAMTQYGHLDTLELGEDIRGPAKRGLLDLIEMALTSRVKEKHTRLTFHQILALVWTGLTDDKSHIKNTDLKPMESFIRELRNVQRAYNKDADGRDLVACFDGIVSGLLNSLNGIHPIVKLDIINRDTVVDLCLVHARNIFWESFSEKISDPRFIIKFHQEIGSDAWKNDELQQWYETCIKAAAESVEQECRSRMQAAGLDESQVEKFMLDWVQQRWIPDTIFGLNEDKNMLDPLKERYLREFHRPLPEPSYVSHSLYQRCVENFPELSGPIAFIVEADSYFGNEEVKNNALIRMREWIEESFRLDSFLHRVTVQQFFEIFHLEKRFMQHEKQLTKSGFLSEKNLSKIRKAIFDYYSAIAHSVGANIIINSSSLSKRLSALDKMMQPWLDSNAFSLIENFFVRWFSALEEENTQEKQTLYAHLNGKKLNQRVAVVVNNFISDADMKGIQVKEITPYQISCIFLYAIIHAPEKWSHPFYLLLEKVVAYIEEINPNDVNTQQLKLDSYPPLLVDQMKYLLDLRKWKLEQPEELSNKPVKPNIIILPHQVETVVDLQPGSQPPVSPSQPIVTENKDEVVNDSNTGKEAISLEEDEQQAQLRNFVDKVRAELASYSGKRKETVARVGKLLDEATPDHQQAKEGEPVSQVLQKLTFNIKAIRDEVHKKHASQLTAKVGGTRSNLVARLSRALVDDETHQKVAKFLYSFQQGQEQHDIFTKAYRGARKTFSNFFSPVDFDEKFGAKKAHEVILEKLFLPDSGINTATMKAVKTLCDQSDRNVSFEDVLACDGAKLKGEIAALISDSPMAR